MVRYEDPQTDSKHIISKEEIASAIHAYAQAVVGPSGKPMVSGNDPQKSTTETGNGCSPQQGESGKATTGSTVLDSCKPTRARVDSAASSGGTEAESDLSSGTVEHMPIDVRIEKQWQRARTILTENKDWMLLEAATAIMEMKPDVQFVTQADVVLAVWDLRESSASQQSKERIARMLVNELRVRYGLPIIKRGDNLGYVVPRSQHQADRFLRKYALEVLSRNASAWTTVQSLSDTLSGNVTIENQLFLNMHNRHNREFEQLDNDHEL